VSANHRGLSAWLKVTGTIYAFAAVDYVARPRVAIAALNQAGGTPMEQEEPGLYNALAGAYMATIAALALSASSDPEERAALIPPLLVGKAASSAALMYRYFKTRRRGYALSAGLDAFLFGVTAGLSSDLRGR
jgi:hypothetical protein